MPASGVAASFMQFLFSRIFGQVMTRVLKAKMAAFLAVRIENW